MPISFEPHDMVLAITTVATDAGAEDVARAPSGTIVPTFPL